MGSVYFVGYTHIRFEKIQNNVRLHIKSYETRHQAAVNW
jgi:hypothetical protein